MKSNAPILKTRAFQLDLGRQPENTSTLKRMIAAAARFGFNQCHLYLENSLKLDAFGPAGRGLSKAEMADVIAFANTCGIEIVPSFNLLGHFENFLVQDAFKEMDEMREGTARQPWQAWHTCACPSLPSTRAWAKAVIDEAVTLFPSANLHVGLDETWTLGSCSLCRKRVEEVGLGGLFADYATFLNNCVKAHQRRMWMWADMCYYYPDTVALMPRDIVMVDWHYDSIGERPVFSFRNWEAIDSTRELVEAGFTVVPAGGLAVDNLTTFLRYAHGLGIDTFLATNWEGTMRFADSITPALCQAGSLLQTGCRVDWKTAGKQLLPDATESERQAFLLAIQTDATYPEPALDILRQHPDCLLHQSARCNLLQKFVENELSDILKESDLAARQALRRQNNVVSALAPVRCRLETALAAGREWLTLLDDLASRYQETKDERGIYEQAQGLVERLERCQNAINAFCTAPSAATFPGNPIELVLEVVVLDPCAHACRIDVGATVDALETVYNVNVLPMNLKTGSGRALIPLQQVPRFVRLSINGYARVGISSIRCRTLAADLLPQKVIASGGKVSDANYLLEWDRKAALFNEADVATTWLKADVTSDNFVLLAFEPAE